MITFSDHVLLKQTFSQHGVEHVQLGELPVEYHPDFQLYITTRLRNPHYLPYVTTKVNIFITDLCPGLHSKKFSSLIYAFFSALYV